MASGSTEIGRYVLPIMPSIDGIGPEVDRKLGRAFAGISKTASQALTSGISDGVDAAEASVRRATANIEKLRDKESAAVDKLRVAEERIAEVREKGGSALARAEAQRNTALRQQKAALSDIESQTKQLETAQRRLAAAQEDTASDGARASNRIAGSMRSAAGSAMSAGRTAAGSFAEGFEASGALGRLGAAGGPIGAALAAIAVVGGKALGDQVASEMAKEVARDLTQAQLGLDDASMAKLSAGAAKAWADNFGDTVQSNIDVGKVALQTGLVAGPDDAALAHTIEQLRTVSLVLGDEIPETARAAGQLIKTGLAKNVDEAFDVITSGAQQGLNISDDWLDTLNEYGTQFRKLGLSAPEAMGLISQALKGGARDTDVAADALKEFSIRAVDGSKTTNDAFAKLGLNADEMAGKFAAGGETAHDALGLVLDGIRNIQDPVEQGRIAAGLFGTQWEDLGKAFNQFDLTKAAEEFSKVEGASQRAADTMSKNSTNEWEVAKRTIIGKIQEIKDALNFGDWGSTIPRAITELFGETPKLTRGAPGVPITGPRVQGPGVVGGITLPVTGAPAVTGGNPLDVFRGGLPSGVDYRAWYPAPRARGGIDGIGTDAHIGGPAYPNGLVRYREPSTGGEAYIPLNGGDRSIDIWEETGRRLGVWAFEQGGFSPDVAAAEALVGTGYSQGSRTDCSGMPARVINRMLGLPDSGLMSTKNAEKWLAERGFRPGLGGPGTVSVGWYDHGPNPNDGHMAMTLSNGMGAEAGGKNGEFTVGAGAAKASDPQFDQHMFLPLQGMYGEGAGADGGAGGYGSAGSIPAGSVAGIDPTTGESGYYTQDPRKMREADERVADADKRVARAEQRQSELKADAKESSKQAAADELEKAKREAADARADRDDAAKGKFTKLKSGKGVNGQGGNDTDPIGGIFGSFLKESLGLDGSIFPDVSQLGIVQLFNALAGIKYTPQGKGFPWQTGYANGNGTPWSGSPFAAAGAPGEAAATSGLPFGMIPSAIDAAGVARPGMAPPGTPASGIGAGPAPGPVDMSRNSTVNVYPTGYDPNEHATLFHREMSRIDRLNTYVPKGA